MTPRIRFRTPDIDSIIQDSVESLIQMMPRPRSARISPLGEERISELVKFMKIAKCDQKVNRWSQRLQDFAS